MSGTFVNDGQSSILPEYAGTTVSIQNNDPARAGITFALNGSSESGAVNIPTPTDGESNCLYVAAGGMIIDWAGNTTAKSLTASTGNITATEGNIAATAGTVSGTNINPATYALTYANPLSVDITKGDVFTVTTTSGVGNATFNASAVGVAGRTITFEITNDASANRTITFGSNFKSAGTLVGTTSKTATITFRSDGTNWRRSPGPRGKRRNSPN